MAKGLSQIERTKFQSKNIIWQVYCRNLQLVFSFSQCKEIGYLRRVFAQVKNNLMTLKFRRPFAAASVPGLWPAC